MKNLLLIAAATFSFASANAAERGGVYLEPGLTYETSSSSIDYPSPLSNSTGSVAGYGLAAKVGFHVNEAILIGVDGRYSRPTFEDSTNNMRATTDSLNYGLLLGAQMPYFGLRLWGGYVLGGMLNPVEAGNLDVRFERPEGYRVGLGMRVAAFGLSLEYQSLTYQTTVLETAGIFSLDTAFNNTKLTNNSYVLNVSFPLEL